MAFDDCCCTHLQLLQSRLQLLHPRLQLLHQRLQLLYPLFQPLHPRLQLLQPLLQLLPQLLTAPSCPCCCREVAAPHHTVHGFHPAVVLPHRPSIPPLRRTGSTGRA